MDHTGSEVCYSSGLPGQIKTYTLGTRRIIGISLVRLILCVFAFVAVFQHSNFAGSANADIRLADARDEAELRCRREFGPGAVAEEEFSFGETGFVCNCAKPHEWNKAKTRCIQNKSQQNAEPQPDATQPEEGDASTQPDDKRQVQAPSQPITKCDELAASPDDPSNATGVGVRFVELKKNPQPAIAACRDALSKNPGAPRVAYQLARALSSAQNYPEAFGLYKTAVDAGHFAAMASLGFLYMEGKGVSRDYAEALRWVRKAADKGIPSAMQSLGYMYHLGRGVTRDYAKALRWYRKAAELGNPFSMNNLGSMYKNGEGVSRDYTEAVRWFRKAARKDNVRAMNNLGKMFEQGNGVSRDYAEAVRWFRLAAEGGFVSSMFRLAVMTKEGHGTTQDFSAAFDWFLKAANAGHSASMHSLSGMLRDGRGVASDNKEAANWMFLALLKGNKRSVTLLTGNPDQTSKQFRQELQRLMKKNGIYAGPIDGDFGPKTKRAIRKLAGQ